eukprot:67661_1
MAERDELLGKLDIQYNLYIFKLLQQKSFITQKIQKQYDQQLNRIQKLLFNSYQNNKAQKHSNSKQNTNQDVDSLDSDADSTHTEPSHFPSPSASASDDEFQCIYCSKSFVHYSDLRSHISEHDSRSDIYRHCPSAIHGQCDFLMNPTHIQNYSAPTTNKRTGKYHCMNCDDSFDNYTALRKHLPVHTERQWICSECPDAFKYINHLSRHMALHERKKDIICIDCVELFECDTSFNCVGALTSHKNRVHSHQVKEQISGHKRKERPRDEVETDLKGKKRKKSIGKQRLKEKNRNDVLNCRIWQLWKLREAKVKSNVESGIGNTLRVLKKELKKFITQNKLCDQWSSEWDRCSFTVLEQTVLFDLCLKKLLKQVV